MTHDAASITTAATAENAGTRRRMALGWLLAAILVATTLVTGAGPAAATGPDSASFVSAVNASRAKAGLPAYTVRSDLASVAYNWATHMAETGTLMHNPNLAKQVRNWTYVGENVGYGPDWRTIETALMNSPSHRANILDRDFTEIGVGVVVVDGRMWVTQVFRKPARTTTSTTTTSKTTTAKTASKTTTSTATAPKPATRPATKPATTAASQPPAGKASTEAPSPAATDEAAPSPAPTPEEVLRSRIDDAAAALPAAAEPDPVAQAGAFVTAMDIVAG